MITLVGCGKAKRENAAPARDLYTSSYFAAKRNYVERSGREWYVLSAKHGLLDPDEVVEPYDAYGLDDDLARDVVDELPDDERIEILAGQDYVEPMRRHVDDERLVLPFEDTGSLFEQMEVLNDG